jgi:hypothetical protein
MICNMKAIRRGERMMTIIKVGNRSYGTLKRIHKKNVLTTAFKRL